MDGIRRSVYLFYSFNLIPRKPVFGVATNSDVRKGIKQVFLRDETLFIYLLPLLFIYLFIASDIYLFFY